MIWLWWAWWLRIVFPSLVLFYRQQINPKTRSRIIEKNFKCKAVTPVFENVNICRIIIQHHPPLKTLVGILVLFVQYRSSFPWEQSNCPSHFWVLSMQVPSPQSNCPSRQPKFQLSLLFVVITLNLIYLVEATETLHFYYGFQRQCFVPQSSSSELSVQSLMWSHFNLWSMQTPLRHLNWFAVQ